MICDDFGSTINTNSAAVKTSNAEVHLKGTNANKVVKVRTDTSFHRPKTLKLARTPKYARKAVPHYNRMDAYKVIVSPIASETAMKKVERRKHLGFQVDIKANRNKLRVL